MKGGQLIYASCSIRFEVEPFYNIQAAEAVMSPAPTPGGGFVNGSDHSGPGSDGESIHNATPPISYLPWSRHFPDAFDS